MSVTPGWHQWNLRHGSTARLGEGTARCYVRDR